MQEARQEEERQHKQTGSEQGLAVPGRQSSSRSTNTVYSHGCEAISIEGRRSQLCRMGSANWDLSERGRSLAPRMPRRRRRRWHSTPSTRKSRGERGRRRALGPSGRKGVEGYPEGPHGRGDHQGVNARVCAPGVEPPQTALFSHRQLREPRRTRSAVKAQDQVDAGRQHDRERGDAAVRGVRAPTQRSAAHRRRENWISHRAPTRSGGTLAHGRRQRRGRAGVQRAPVRRAGQPRAGQRPRGPRPRHHDVGRLQGAP